MKTMQAKIQGVVPNFDTEPLPKINKYVNVAIRPVVSFNGLTVKFIGATVFRFPED